ncbi:MAG: hypothetical protein HYV36_08095 [Lentisphaerae bacterium]|nr:hypothetical protein [Lentisphaerota bacterium]
MNIVDENIPAAQRELLQSWGIHVRQIGYDIGGKGLKDDNIIPLLLRLRLPTFFTRDRGFYQSHLCHAHYCLVAMEIDKDESAFFIRALLRHPHFNTQAKRMGQIIHLSPWRISTLRLHAAQTRYFKWNA